MKSVPTGIVHGTVTVIADGRPFEVTTLRRDVTTDGRRATVAFTDDWGADARRRDFTINALYCDMEGTILDPVGGLADLAAQRVRFVGSAAERIREDYLRVLRFFRIFAWYGSGRPDPEALKACARLKAGLATLSAERVWAELKRILSAPDPARALLWMRTTEVLQKVLPECWGIDAIHRLLAAEQAEGWPPDALLRLAAILPPHRARLDALAERLRLSHAESARLHAWADAPEPDPAMADAKLAQVLYRVSGEGMADRLRLAIAREAEAGNRETAEAFRRQLAFAGTWQRPAFPVSGKDLVAKGVAPGPEVGKRLRELEGRWVESGFSLTRDELIAAG